MIDPTMLSHVALGGVLSKTIQEQLDKYIGGPTPLNDILEESNRLLQLIVDAVSTPENSDQTLISTLNVYPLFWRVPTYIHNHLCAILPAGITINYQVPGMTVISRVITQGGWYQLDLPEHTTLWASAVAPILLKWCNSPVGTAV